MLFGSVAIPFSSLLQHKRVLVQSTMQEVRFPSYLPFPFVNMVHRIRSCVLLPLNLLLFLVNFRKFVKHIGKSFLFFFLLSLDSLLTYCDFVFCSLRITRDDSRISIYTMQRLLIINATLLPGSSEAQRSKSDFADSQSLSASCASPRRNHALAVSAFSSIALCQKSEIMGFMVYAFLTTDM